MQPDMMLRELWGMTFIVFVVGGGAPCRAGGCVRVACSLLCLLGLVISTPCC